MGRLARRQKNAFKLFFGKKTFGIIFAASSVLAAPQSIGLVQAESLRSAMANAYLNNPKLAAERARQRATDEKVPQAR